MSAYRIMEALETIKREKTGETQEEAASSEELEQITGLAISCIRYTCETLVELGFIRRRQLDKRYLYESKPEYEQKYKRRPRKQDVNPSNLFDLMQELFKYGGITIQDHRIKVNVRMDLPD